MTEFFMNKYFIHISILIGMLHGEHVFSAAGPNYPISSPLFNAGVAISRSFLNANFVNVDEFNDAKYCPYGRTRETAFFPVEVKLVERYCNNASKKTAHIGIYAGALNWGVTEEEAMKPSVEDLKLVHEAIKDVIRVNDITAIDSMAAMGRAGTLLSHVVHGYRLYYQKYKPTVVTFNATNLISAPYQIHMAFEELLKTAPYNACKEIYKPIKDRRGEKLFRGYSKEGNDLLNRLTDEMSIETEPKKSCKSKAWRSL